MKKPPSKALAKKKELERIEKFVIDALIERGYAETEAQDIVNVLKRAKKPSTATVP